jgi:hypothetical protein
MGDAESTVKRFYVRTLEPGVGKKWFSLSEKTLVNGSAKVAQKRKMRSSVSITNL